MTGIAVLWLELRASRQTSVESGVESRLERESSLVRQRKNSVSLRELWMQWNAVQWMTICAQNKNSVSLKFWACLFFQLAKYYARERALFCSRFGWEHLWKMAHLREPSLSPHSGLAQASLRFSLSPHWTRFHQTRPRSHQISCLRALSYDAIWRHPITKGFPSVWVESESKSIGRPMPKSAEQCPRVWLRVPFSCWQWHSIAFNGIQCVRLQRISRFRSRTVSQLWTDLLSNSELFLSLKPLMHQKQDRREGEKQRTRFDCWSAIALGGIKSQSHCCVIW